MVVPSNQRLSIIPPNEIKETWDAWNTKTWHVRTNFFVPSEVKKVSINYNHTQSVPFFSTIYYRLCNVKLIWFCICFWWTQHIWPQHINTICFGFWPPAAAAAEPCRALGAGGNCSQWPESRPSDFFFFPFWKTLESWKLTTFNIVFDVFFVVKLRKKIRNNTITTVAGKFCYIHSKLEITILNRKLGTFNLILLKYFKDVFKYLSLPYRYRHGSSFYRS